MRGGAPIHSSLFCPARTSLSHRTDLQRKSTWFEGVLISAKLFLFAQDAARTSLPDTPPRHVLSLVGSVVEHGTRSYSIVLTSVTRPDKKISLCAPTRMETQQWADALRGAAMTETCLLPLAARASKRA